MFQSIPTLQTGVGGTGELCLAQVDVVGVQACRGDGQVVAELVDIVGQGTVHVQRPLAAHLLGLSVVQARRPENNHKQI